MFLDLEDVVDEALPRILNVQNEYEAEIASATANVANASAAVAAAKTNLNNLELEKTSITTNTSRSGRQGRRTAATLSATDQTRLVEIAEAIGGVKNELKHLRKTEKEARDALKESEERFEKWKEKFPCRTKQQLMQHGKNIIAPAAKYYNDLFLSPDGRHRNMRIMATAAKIFDPVMLSQCSDGDVDSYLCQISLISSQLLDTTTLPRDLSSG